MIKKLIRMGNSQLQDIAKPVITFNTPELLQLIQDLFDTMYANEGVGIAAPQIGVPLQVVVFGFEAAKRYPHAKPVPKTVLINPTFKPLDENKNEDWEGCLSVKGLRGIASRYSHIVYQGYDQYGNYFEREAHNFHARLVQHEIDHLNGKLFIERINNLKYFGFEEELQEVMKRTGSKLR